MCCKQALDCFILLLMHKMRSFLGLLFEPAHSIYAPAFPLVLVCGGTTPPLSPLALRESLHATSTCVCLRPCTFWFKVHFVVPSMAFYTLATELAKSIYRRAYCLRFLCVVLMPLSPLLPLSSSACACYDRVLLAQVPAAHLNCVSCFAESSERVHKSALLG